MNEVGEAVSTDISAQHPHYKENNDKIRAKMVASQKANNQDRLFMKFT
jgi:hypothetical protein